MNIKEAKQEVERTVRAYLSKDAYGDYRVDVVHQRPVLLIGAPGIGKTAIMQQIAQEMGIGLVSYSMTHHTRQSAIGLPYIEKKLYDGKEYAVSDYTMSEIISSVYAYREETGLKEGILFLDEINCVSETLSPAMLQFLQYKTFGNHPVPKGWVIVTAGNPPQYNKSVREFDVATLDRVKKMEVEPDFSVWKEYAKRNGVHPAVITYLEVKPSQFYVVESTIDGKAFVTARGWEDLSQMMQLYEEMGEPIDEGLCLQYLQHTAVAKEFALYYQLYQKYRSDYQVLDILEGKYGEDVVKRAKEARFDERVTLLSLLTDAVIGGMKETLGAEQDVEALYEQLKLLKAQSVGAEEPQPLAEVLKSLLDMRKKEFELRREKGLLGADAARTARKVIDDLERDLVLLAQKGNLDNKKAFQLLKKEFDKKVKALEQQAQKTKEQMEEMFGFVETVFGKEQEMLLLVTEMTSNYFSSRFIAKYGADKYYENNRDLLFYERGKDILKEISLLDGMMK